MALRAIPHLWVIRPADANETSVAWKVALQREDGPVAILLSRQDVPVLDRRETSSAEGLERGAYVVWESPESERQPDVLLIATGAEVAPTLAAARSLGDRDINARVVSMPCWELFELQPQEYRDDVLPPEVRARLAVEPGSSLGWWRWVGDGGDVIGIERFGASAPGGQVLEKFGFSADAIEARALELLERTPVPSPIGGAPDE
jgi:transketolase